MRQSGRIDPRLLTPSPAALRWLLRLVGVLLLVGVGASFAVGANRPPAPHLVPPSADDGLTGHSSPTSGVPGFGHIGFRVVSASGAVSPRYCALLADTVKSQEQGMMGRHDLAGYNAMVFRFPTDSTDAFYNLHVPIALSIAWFDSAGVYVGGATLQVCTAPCPTIAPSVAYRYALETPRGGLSHLGVGQGSVLLVGGSCS